jgi:hypothetical protein
LNPSRLRKNGELGAISPLYFRRINEEGAQYRVGTR